MEPIKPLPPSPIPVTPPDFSKLPHDGQTEREYIMASKIETWKNKTILRSRTIVSVAVTILSFVAVKFFGLDIDLGLVIDSADGLQLGELILSVGALVAAYFRKNQRVDFSKPPNG